MNTKNKSLLIAVLLGIGLLFGIAQSISANTSQTYQDSPSPIPEVLEKGWHRFTDEEAGYSFDYPPNAVYISYGKNKGETYNHVFIDFVEMGSSQGMILTIEPNPNRLSTEEFLTAWYATKTNKTSQPFFSKEEMGKLFSIDGEQAIQTELVTRELHTSYSFHVIFVNGDKAFITGPVYGVTRSSAVAPEAEDLFMQILETFRFNP